MYEHLLKVFKIESPTNIWNTDKSGVQDVLKEEVIGATGKKAHTMSLKEQGETTSFNVCKCLWPGLPSPSNFQR